MGALYKGFFMTLFISVILFALITQYSIGFDQFFQLGNKWYNGMDLFLCAVYGLLITLALVFITEYYTSTEFSPVKSVANSSQSGHATNIIQGLAISMQSTALPTIVIILGIVSSIQCP